MSVIRIEDVAQRLRERRAKQSRPAELRPYAIHYYVSDRDKTGDFGKTTRAKTPAGAVMASFRHLLTGRYAKATVHGLDGEVLFRLHRKGRQINVFGWFAHHTFLDS